jgi:hypothetical protein
LEDVVDKILSHDNDTKAVGSKSGGKKDNVPECYPETRDFNTVINCCAFARGIGIDAAKAAFMDDEELVQLQEAKRAIFVIAEGVFGSLLKSEYAHPNSDTFLGMIRACQSLLPDNRDRDARVIELFRLAYQTPSPLEESHKPMTSYSARLQAPKGGGCVNANVLRQLRLALPSTEEYISVREEFEEYRRKNSE